MYWQYYPSVGHLLSLIVDITDFEFIVLSAFSGLNLERQLISVDR
jgi:hypothetical protein